MSICTISLLYSDSICFDGEGEGEKIGRTMLVMKVGSSVS